MSLDSTDPPAGDGLETPTVRASAIVFGPLGVDLDDPAETYHEASAYYPSFHGRETWAGSILTRSTELQESVRRSIRRNPNRLVVPLPPPELPATPVRDAIGSRSSRRSFSGEPVSVSTLASTCYSGYGMRAEDRIRYVLPSRVVPSGGALFPLQFIVAVERVNDIDPGLYSYDPADHCLEMISAGSSVAAMEDGAPTAASFIGDAAFVVFISAVFWRTRFKYGQRGYRFVLLEAGHAMQNMLLCSEGLGLASCPIGGFYDSRINALVALDGVTEAVVYFACFGCRATVEADPS